MKTFPGMVDLARTEADKAKDSPMGLVTPSVSDLPDYDYGLNISFNKETLEKLDLDEDCHVGDYICIHAFAKVTGLNQPPGADKPDRVNLVLTHVCASDDDEDEEDGAY
jgi:hypothetical protein